MKKISGKKILDGFLNFILFLSKYGIMALIVYILVSIFGVTFIQKFSIMLAKSTNFGTQAPKDIDILIMVGIPTLFVSGFIFIWLNKIFKICLNGLNKFINKIKP